MKSIWSPGARSITDFQAKRRSASTRTQWGPGASGPETSGVVPSAKSSMVTRAPSGRELTRSSPGARRGSSKSSTPCCAARSDRQRTHLPDEGRSLATGGDVGQIEVQKEPPRLGPDRARHQSVHPQSDGGAKQACLTLETAGEVAPALGTESAAQLARTQQRAARRLGDAGHRHLGEVVGHSRVGVAGGDDDHGDGLGCPHRGGGPCHRQRRNQDDRRSHRHRSRMARTNSRSGASGASSR